MFGNPVRGVIRPREAPYVLGSFRVTSTFAEHVASGRGPGVDIGCGRCGDDLIAMTTGVVSLAGYIGASLVVRIVSDDNPAYEVAVAHCASISVAKGARVTRGQKIGTLGMTGADACHCHIGCKKNGVEVDIWPLLDQNLPEVEVLKGTNVVAVTNRRVTILGDNTRFRGSPALLADNILAAYDTGLALDPDYIVDGAAANGSVKWYGAWGLTIKGREFGYVHASTVSSAVVIEASGFTQAQMDAAIAAALATAKAACDAAVADAAAAAKAAGVAQGAVSEKGRLRTFLGL